MIFLPIFTTLLSIMTYSQLKLFSLTIPAAYIFSLKELVLESKKKVKSVKSWTGLQRDGNLSIERR